MNHHFYVKKSLLLGAVQTTIVGAIHFALPYMWNWQKFTNLLPMSIEWGFNAINFLFSFLLVFFGLSTMLILTYKEEKSFGSKVLFCGVTSFWLLSFIYQLLIPFPLPFKYGYLNFVFRGIALLSSVLFFYPLFILFHSKKYSYE